MMHNHPAPAVWLTMGCGLLLLAVLHAWAVLGLATARPGERAWMIKPRTYWLLLLTFVNPLMPLTALIVVAFVFKSVSDGDAAEGSLQSAS
jgi:hypothetical protein